MDTGVSSQRTHATVIQRNRPSNNLHLCEVGTGNYKPNRVCTAVNGATLAPSGALGARLSLALRLVPLFRQYYFKPFSYIAM